ncbi:hypothetical protein R8O04_12790 [Vibrio sp. 2094]|uniref:hypothetical protein n=1 Tax=unclassified Vibrio TaxID=2614977 RepID=UPI002964E9D4|nr:MULTISPECIES: hypothetical protein [unclassified Vibrio]MDW2072145.1 hypothetical protein [Vibrio sp. 2096]MDW3141901.1 hypothetical protein [Vibrio sp. 2094]
MNPVGNTSVNSYAKQSVASKQASIAQEETSASPLKVEHNKVTLSTEGKALLAALQQIEHDSKKIEAKDKSVGEKVESFTHGALGMDHPDKIEKEEDGSYSAGQYLSAALTVGGIILALV